MVGAGEFQQYRLPFGPEAFAQIFVAGVAENGNDYGFLVSLQLEGAGDLQASYYGCGGGNSYQQSGFAGHLARHGVRVFG